MIIHRDPLSAVHMGDCLDAKFADEVMGGRRADALIFDAPYGSKVHEGHAAGFSNGLNTRSLANYAKRSPKQGNALLRYAHRVAAGAVQGRRDIAYEAFDENKIAAFCSVWLPHCTGWVVSITDDTLAPIWKAEFERAGLYAFTALPLVELGGRVRLAGDGPSSWTCWIIVARPRREPYTKWGTLPGAYVQAAERKSVVGGKPFRSMCAIVADYSKRGDLIVDPVCGGGGTLAAAKHLGRRSIGIDRDELHAKLSAKRVAKTHEQMSLFEASPIEPMRQLSLLGEP